MLLLPFVLYVLLASLYNEGYALEMCGRFTYHHIPNFDDQSLTDVLEGKMTPTRAECFSDCFHHRYCNRLLYNELTNQCHLHSSEGSFLSTSSGFKYYAADCSISKSSTLPVCPSQFAPFEGSPGSTGMCYDGEDWVDDGNGDFICLQNEWFNTLDTTFPLPATITPGFVVDITGTWNNNVDLFCALRQTDHAAETILLRIQPDGISYIGQISDNQWLSSVDLNFLPISYGVPFNMRATFNSTHYQISLDGTPVVTDELLNQVSEATYLYVVDWSLIEHVRFTYP